MKINFFDLLVTGRGSTALWLIFQVLSKQSAKVLVPVNICEIVYPIIINSGLNPVFYDVDSKLGIATPQIIKEAYTGEEDILIVLHQFGLPVEIDAICSWAESENIFVIEDVCCALGASYKGHPLGTWGNAAIFSFGYSKILEYGIGGAVYCRDRVIYQKIHDQIQKLPAYSYEHKIKEIELQSRIKDLRTSINISKIEEYNEIYDYYMDFLLFKLKQEDIDKIRNLYRELEENLETRSYFADRYREEITNNKVRHVNKIIGQTYWRYNILVEPDNQKKIIEGLRQNGLLASNWYPPMAKFFDKSYEPQKFSGSESFAKRVINLFVDHRVNDSRVTECVNYLNTF
jgi:perosamine synthetase